jgi:hypothetical protein
LYTRLSSLLAIIIAATSLTAGCAKQSSTPETNDASGTIMAAKRALNTESESTANADSATVSADVVAAEIAIKDLSSNSPEEAKHAAGASAGGPKNGDREIDHNKWK